MYVKWENNEIVLGPQSEQGDGDGWYPHITVGEKTSTRDEVRTELHEDWIVVTRIENAEPTYDVLREYGALEEQLDKLFHDIDNGTLDKTGQFYTFIKGVKDAYPKPGD